MNHTYFGEGAYGLEAASQIYWGKSARQLNRVECALLAGLPQAPSRYNPYLNPTLAVARRNQVLSNWVDAGGLSAAEAARLKTRPLSLYPAGRALSAHTLAPFFTRRVLEEALQALHLDEPTFWAQGVQVVTTLDPRAQRLAEAQVRRLSARYGRVGPNRQAALLSLDEDGRILAYVGGKNYRTTQFDRVVRARRPVGSLLKVLVYTAAMEQGIAPSARYLDEPVRYGAWIPQNYDRQHHGRMTLARAFVQSNNVVAVKLTQAVSPQAVVDVARRLGIESALKPDLSLALGAVEASLQEMTTAFNVFNHQGMRVRPVAIQTILDRQGRVRFEPHREPPVLVLAPEVRDTMVALMQGVVNYGTGHRAQQSAHTVAGKTGTSDDYRDAWFIGFTPGVTTGVWVGNDDNAPMPGITGGALPAELWQAYMAGLLAGEAPRSFTLSHARPIAVADFLEEEPLKGRGFSLWNTLFGWMHPEAGEGGRHHASEGRPLAATLRQLGGAPAEQAMDTLQKDWSAWQQLRQAAERHLKVFEQAFETQDPPKQDSTR